MVYSPPWIIASNNTTMTLLLDSNRTSFRMSSVRSGLVIVLVWITMFINTSLGAPRDADETGANHELEPISNERIKPNLLISTKDVARGIGTR